MDLRAQLQQHLGSSYALERELGGGGMSRVFVADEMRLGRKVVIKVLSPDLAQGINAERFEREIKVAASLQQANIVPLHAAGDVAGLPYFTMPFVEGESLRQRLTQGAMPVNEVVGVLRDVARALAYAHARGVVHRDIKPDNVLLSGGAAVVTDFGIAKAISASRTQAPSPGAAPTLTQLGTSLGTPAYMAPEQVAGDPTLDHRVDLYALGCVAFELLSGQQPFANRSPQKTLAAHLSEAAPQVTLLRPDTPPLLAELVTRLMAKDPDDRPQSATEVLQALDDAVTTSASTMAFSAPVLLKKALLLYALATVVLLLCAKAAIIAIGLPDWVLPGAIVVAALGLPALLVTAYVQRVARHAAIATPTLTPGGTMVPKMPSGTMATMAMRASPHVTWRRTWRGGAIAVGVFIAVVLAFMVTRALGIGPWGSLRAAGTFGGNDGIVLADLTASAGDSALAPIVVEAIRAAMSQSNAVHVIEPSAIADALQEMKRPRDTPLNDASVIHDVAARTNARAILGGRLAQVGTGYVVSLDLTATQGGAVLASYQGTANGVKDLLGVVDGMTRKLRSRVGESLKHVQRSIPLERATTSSLEALRKYSQAVVANDVDEDFPRAIQLSRQAVSLDTTFALAWRKLAVALKNSGASLAAQDTAVEQAARYADRLPDLEKDLVMGAYYETDQRVLDRGKALAAYERAYAFDSTNVTAANELMRNYASRLQFDSADRYAHRVHALSPGPARAVGLVLTLLQQGRFDSARAFVDSEARATPGTGTNVMVLQSRSLVYSARGQWDSLHALSASLQRSPNIPVRLFGINAGQPVATFDGRLTEALAFNGERAALNAGRDAANPITELPAARMDIWFRGRMTEGAQMLDSILAGKEWAELDPLDRPWEAVVQLYAMAGKSVRARTVFEQFLATDPGARAPDSQAEITALRGEIALAERKYAEAIKQFRASATGADGAPSDLTGAAYVDFSIARAFDGAGQADSARAYLERYLAVPRIQRPDPQMLAAVQRRLGELYDAANDRPRALEHYGAFVSQWKDADPDLQASVTAVKKRMAELGAREGQ